MIKHKTEIYIRNGTIGFSRTKNHKNKLDKYLTETIISIVILNFCLLTKKQRNSFASNERNSFSKLNIKQQI